jgi:cell division septation protein DedD
MDTVTLSTPAEERANQVFVDTSGRRGRLVNRCGYVLGMGCVGYIGLVALGLSGTRVGALPGIPVAVDHEIIAGLSGQGGSLGLHLTPTPMAANPPTSAPAHVWTPVRRAVAPVRTAIAPVRTPAPAAKPTSRPAVETVRLSKKDSPKSSQSDGGKSGSNHG